MTDTVLMWHFGKIARFTAEEARRHRLVVSDPQNHAWFYTLGQVSRLERFTYKHFDIDVEDDQYLVESMSALLLRTVLGGKISRWHDCTSYAILGHFELEF